MTKFKVGDKVRVSPYCKMKHYSRHGVGVIIQVDTDPNNQYPYTIEFNVVSVLITKTDINYFSESEIYKDNKYIKKHEFKSR